MRYFYSLKLSLKNAVMLVVMAGDAGCRGLSHRYHSPSTYTAIGRTKVIMLRFTTATDNQTARFLHTGWSNILATKTASVIIQTPICHTKIGPVKKVALGPILAAKTGPTVGD